MRVKKCKYSYEIIIFLNEMAWTLNLYDHTEYIISQEMVPRCSSRYDWRTLGSLLYRRLYEEHLKDGVIVALLFKKFGFIFKYLSILNVFCLVTELDDITSTIENVFIYSVIKSICNWKFHSFFDVFL